MADLELNKELLMQVPESFRIMDKAEVAKMNTSFGPPEICLSDPEHHIIITAAFKKSGLGAMLLSAGDVAKKMEQQLRGPMASYGYDLERFVSEDLAGSRAEGFMYTYTAQDIAMLGESFAVRKKKTFYYIHCYMRENLREESLRIIKDIFNTAKWKE